MQGGRPGAATDTIHLGTVSQQSFDGGRAPEPYRMVQWGDSVLIRFVDIRAVLDQPDDLGPLLAGIWSSLTADGGEFMWHGHPPKRAGLGNKSGARQKLLATLAVLIETNVLAPPIEPDRSLGAERKSIGDQ